MNIGRARAHVVISDASGKSATTCGWQQKRWSLPLQCKKAAQRTVMFWDVVQSWIPSQ